MIEDIITAFAWLYVNKSSFDALDLYFAMLQRKALASFGSTGPRSILNVIGAPENVLSNKRVDKLSLSLRNEAFPFVLVHELEHLLFKRKGLADITPAPPLGAVLFSRPRYFLCPIAVSTKPARHDKPT